MCHLCKKTDNTWQYRDMSFCSMTCLKKQVIKDKNKDMMIVLNIKQICVECKSQYVEKCNNCEYKRLSKESSEKSSKENNQQNKSLENFVNGFIKVIEQINDE